MFPIPLGVLGAVSGWTPFQQDINRVNEGRHNGPYPFTSGERNAIVGVALFIIAALSFLCWLAGGSPFWALLYHGTLIFCTMPLMVIRQWVEHFNADDEGRDPRYFHIRSNRFERFLLSPMNFCYHGAHHHYPWIAFYNLPDLQAYIAERGIKVSVRPSYLHAVRTLRWKAG